MAMYSTGLGYDWAAIFPLLILEFLSPFFFPACLTKVETVGLVALG